MSTATCISSVGHICAALQRPYGTIRKAIEELGLTPAVIINMVAHYADDDVEKIREHLQKQPHAKPARGAR